MRKFRVLVFPCGSEIGLEIYRSLQYSTHIELLGGSSVDDHGRFVYENYIDKIPFIDSPELISHLKNLVWKYNIDAIYPAMDKVIYRLKSNEKTIGCKIITSSVETTEICLSKRKTYNHFSEIINVPKTYNKINEITDFPVFVKPDIGYGSRGVFLAHNNEELQFFVKNKCIDDCIISEYLPGKEYTVDCFTDSNGVLLFCGPRIRNRISNGISVNTKPVGNNIEEFVELAEIINKKLKLQGAWFFQVKRNSEGLLVLLEIAARLGGSSSLYRGKGINFALLSIFDAMGAGVEILSNDFDIEQDRALDIRFKLDINYSTIYVDFDDCLIINNKVNIQLVAFLYNSLNRGKKIILLTKHKDDIHESLEKFRLSDLFDKIIKIEESDLKSNHISELDSIFIDDSFSERKEVKIRKKIPVFSPDMIDALQNI